MFKTIVKSVRNVFLGVTPRSSHYGSLAAVSNPGRILLRSLDRKAIPIKPAGMQSSDLRKSAESSKS